MAASANVASVIVKGMSNTNFCHLDGNAMLKKTNGMPANKVKKSHRDVLTARRVHSGNPSRRNVVTLSMPRSNHKASSRSTKHTCKGMARVPIENDFNVLSSLAFSSETIFGTK